jgi:hypothetical protein
MITLPDSPRIIPTNSKKVGKNRYPNISQPQIWDKFGIFGLNLGLCLRKVGIKAAIEDK